MVEADLVLLSLEVLVALHRLGEDEWAILVFRKRCEGLDEAFRLVEILLMQRKIPDTENEHLFECSSISVPCIR